MDKEEEDDIHLYVTKNKTTTTTTTSNHNNIKEEEQPEDDDDYAPPKDIDDVNNSDEVEELEDDDDYAPPKDMDEMELLDCDFDFDTSDFNFEDDIKTSPTTTTTTATKRPRSNNNKNNKNNNSNININKAIKDQDKKNEKRLADLKKNGIEQASAAKKKTTTTPKKTTTTTTSKKTSTPKKIPPSFKVIHGTSFLVDGFQYKSEDYKHYFLTHFHSDHYQGITKTWSFGKIYCTEATGTLVSHKLGVDEKYIVKCDWDRFIDIEGVNVAFLNANHCPGSAMILFNREITNGLTGEKHQENYLHTGDFRYDKSMNTYPLLMNRTIDKLYLDNTFCSPEFVFPPQADIIKQVAQIIRSENNGSTLFLFGTYVIGKEKILLEISKQEGKQINVSQEKYGILKCLGTCLDLSRFTTSIDNTPFRAVAMTMLGYDNMMQLLQQSNGKYKRVFGFRPTGWTQSSKSAITHYSRNASHKFYSVAYSEHSSYSELRNCIDHFRPKEIIPTVDCNTNAKVQNILSHFDDIYGRAKRNSIPSFFSIQPVANFITSFFKSTSELLTKSTTTTTTTTSNTSSNCGIFSDDLIDFDCSDDILVNNQLLKIYSNEKAEKDKGKDSIIIDDDLTMLPQPSLSQSNNNNNNNNNNSLVLSGGGKKNQEEEETFDFEDPAFINRQKYIELQISNSNKLNNPEFKTPVKSSNSTGNILGKNKSPSTSSQSSFSPSSQSQSNNKKFKTAPPSPSNNNSQLKRSKSESNVKKNLSTPPPPDQLLITSFFQKSTPTTTTTTTTTKATPKKK